MCQGRLIVTPAVGTWASIGCRARSGPLGGRKAAVADREQKETHRQQDQPERQRVRRLFRSLEQDLETKVHELRRRRGQLEARIVSDEYVEDFVHARRETE